MIPLSAINNVSIDIRDPHDCSKPFVKLWIIQKEINLNEQRKK